MADLELSLPAIEHLLHAPNRAPSDGGHRLPAECRPLHGLLCAGLPPGPGVPTQIHQALRVHKTWDEMIVRMSNGRPLRLAFSLSVTFVM